MPVDRLLLGPSLKAITAPFERCHYGQQWRWDGVEFTVLHPAMNYTSASDNNTSCVLRIVAAGGSALLLGDAEKPVEQQLVAERLVPGTSLVVAGHHGSRSSSTPELVAATQAREVIFSAGYRNRWGFPKPDIVQRWRQVGARTDSTIEAGAVNVLITPTGLNTPRLYRQLRRRYWQPS
jgi:competence protein ComEC